MRSQTCRAAHLMEGSFSLLRTVLLPRMAVSTNARPRTRCAGGAQRRPHARRNAVRAAIRVIVIAVVVLVVAAWSLRVLSGNGSPDLGDGLIVLTAWLVSAADKVLAPRAAIRTARTG